MNRLQSELHRLYLPPSLAHAQARADTVRAVVIELTQPPCWDDLSRVWYGVQTELELPAPAIAVSGIDGLQLWFSIAEPIALAQAQAFLEGLCARFLPDIAARRLRLLSEPGDRLVPALQEPTGNWSAFVAPDLAPVFADTPWLDVPPSEEGQAALLRGLHTMKPPAFEAAMEKLGLGAAPLTHKRAAAATVAVTAAARDDPKRFLLQVMNDDAVPLALRIDAAKALLQHSNEHRPQ